MEERTKRTITKSLYFSNSGETLSVEITLDNVSPKISKDCLTGFLDELYKRAKEEYLELIIF